MKAPERECACDPRPSVTLCEYVAPHNVFGRELSSLIITFELWPHRYIVNSCS